MTGKLIIIEGTDGSGKTTLIKGLKKTIHIDYVFNYSYPIGCTVFQEASYAEGQYIASINIFSKLLEKGNTIVCDRFHLGEYAYGPIKRDYPKWLAKEILKVEDYMIKELGKENIILVILGFFNYENSKGRIKKEDYLKNLEEVKKINNRYSEAFLFSKLNKWFIYTDYHNPEEVLKEVGNIIL